MLLACFAKLGVAPAAALYVGDAPSDLEAARAAGAEFVAVGDQDRVFINETPTPGYGTVNLSASYLIPTKHFAHIFSVNAYNLTDKLAYNHVSFIKEISPEIGRGVRFGYTVRFF
jgi:iron complex outermembrane receptor protein